MEKTHPIDTGALITALSSNQNSGASFARNNGINRLARDPTPKIPPVNTDITLLINVCTNKENKS